MGQHTEFWQKTSWFAVQTKAHQEHIAAMRVARGNVEVFLPQIRGHLSLSNRVRSLAKALFPGYFFARFCPLESLDAVRYAPGVLRVVGSSRLPSAVPLEILTDIWKQIEPDGFIRLEANGFKPGDKVIVEQGPFQGWVGEVQREQDGGRRVMILLQALQHARLSVSGCCLSAALSAA
jgi:transcriptional antiterminator RfaH